MFKSVLAIAQLSAITVFLTGCATTPLGYNAQQDKFAVENFIERKISSDEYVYLMCRYQKPVKWSNTLSQFEPGEHNLVVIATKTERGTTRYATATFKQNFAAGKRYKLKREVTEHGVQIWFEDSDNQMLSDKITTAYRLGRYLDHNEERSICQASSV